MCVSDCGARAFVVFNQAENSVLPTLVLHLLSRDHSVRSASLRTARIESWQQTIGTILSISWIRMDSSFHTKDVIYSAHRVYVMKIVIYNKTLRISEWALCITYYQNERQYIIYAYITSSFF